MKLPDRRPRLYSAVLTASDLSYREKVYLLTVLSIEAETVDGKRREFSRAMDSQGKYTLHVDYIARAMGKTAHAVREAREGCEEKGWLQRVHEGTHGRPACYQAFVNRGTSTGVRVGFYYRLRDADKPHPYGIEEPLQGCGQTPPLPIEAAQSQPRGETAALPSVPGGARSSDADGVEVGVDHLRDEGSTEGSRRSA